MIALQTAIQTAAAALIPATISALFFGRAEPPPGGQLTYPYAIAQIESSNTQTSFGNAHYNDVAVRFQVVGYNNAAVGAACEALDALFRDTPLSLGSGNGQVTNCYRMHEPRPVPAPDPQVQVARPVYTWIVAYIYSVRN